METLHLYGRILRVHRHLPPQMKALGNAYVRDEFRRHRIVTPEELATFTKGWKQYVAELERQVVTGDIRGVRLESRDVNSFRDDQLVQLHELKEASEKGDEVKDGNEGTMR